MTCKRDLQNPKVTQMTIFYDGLVNVFDNIPVEKVSYLCDARNLFDVTSVLGGMIPDCVITVAGSRTYAFGKQGIHSESTECSS